MSNDAHDSFREACRVTPLVRLLRTTGGQRAGQDGLEKT